MPSVRILENIDHAIKALHCIWCLHRIELNALIITKSATPYFHYSLDKHSYLSQIHSILTYASHVLCDFHNRSHFWISSCMTSANQRVHSNNDKAVLKIRTICHAWNLSKPAIDNKQGKSEGFDSCNRPSNLTQIGFKSSIFQPVWPWNLMDDPKK